MKNPYAIVKQTRLCNKRTKRKTQEKAMDDIKAKQQVVEKIKEASKILITVSNNPSVDALSAALGLTLLFDNQKKYATAIFSGEVPPAIAFLEPQKTFDDTTDSLRDFIIALNKEKADHLRYKVEGDSVKIFITPYKTTITKDDLEFSQGDYNVELVIALGVDTQEHLDKALDAHGQILHDATVITVTAGEQTSKLGGIDWHDASASSLSEMVAGLAEALKEDKKKSLIDPTIATALLTGIVAETERFSNEHTTSKVMTVAAQLMSAGADQQLIATELQEANEAPIQSPEVEEAKEVEENTAVADDGSLGNIAVHKDEISIDHTGETLAELDRRIRKKRKDATTTSSGNETPQQNEPINQLEQPVEEPPVVESVYAPAEPVDEPIVAPADPVEEPLQQSSTQVSPEPTPTIPTLPPVAKQETPISNPVNAYAPEDDGEPSLGGTLNATTEQAAEDARKLALSDQNKTILSHAYVAGSEQQNGADGVAGAGFPGAPSVAPGSVAIDTVEQDVHPAYTPTDTELSQPSTPGLGVGGEKVIEPLPSVATPNDLGLPLPPPVPDFSQGAYAPPAAPVFSSPPTGQGVVPEPVSSNEILGNILAPETPDPHSAYAFEPIETPPPTSSAKDDPSQFKIPG